MHLYIHRHNIHRPHQQAPQNLADHPMITTAQSSRCGLDHENYTAQYNPITSKHHNQEIATTTSTTSQRHAHKPPQQAQEVNIKHQVTCGVHCHPSEQNRDTGTRASNEYPDTPSTDCNSQGPRHAVISVVLRGVCQPIDPRDEEILSRICLKLRPHANFSENEGN